jgi:ubiquinone/menaquinone biosynthesis C-methylase UbiE
MVDQINLIETVQEMNRMADEAWLSNLNDQKLEEMKHADTQRDSKVVNNLSSDEFEKSHGNKKFYKTVELSQDYFQNRIKQAVQDKIHLDFACGNGNTTIKSAKSGAKLAIGLDLSRVSIKNATQKAEEEKLSDKVYFYQGDCEKTGLPDNSIDVITCLGVLHHMNLSYVFHEMRRILKPGGVILVNEALAYNPLIQIYRNRTPQMRTEWEKDHIISHKEINFASHFFDVKEINYWHLFSIAAAYFPTTLNFLNFIDSIALKVPFLRNMAWQITFELHKKS